MFIFATTGVALTAITAVVSHIIRRNKKKCSSSVRRSADQDLTSQGTTSATTDDERIEEVEAPAEKAPPAGLKAIAVCAEEEASIAETESVRPSGFLAWDYKTAAGTYDSLSIDGDDGGGVLGAGAGATDQDGVGKISVPPKIIMTIPQLVKLYGRGKSVSVRDAGSPSSRRCLLVERLVRAISATED